MVHKPDGTDVWVFEGRQIPNIGLNAVAGRVPEEYGMEPTALSQLRKGCYDVHARIDDMNVNGVLGSMCFSSVPGFVGELFAKQPDKELARAMLQAYNDWHIDGWCGAYPGRFIPLALPMLNDPAATAAEAEALATSLFLAGSATAAREADLLGIPTVLVTADGRVQTAGGLR